MTDITLPFAEKKFIEIKGRRMAYIDEGEGAAIVFAHGNPTSSFLWRNVMPACRGLGRLIACDMIGMGDSDKLPDSGPHLARDTFRAFRSSTGARDRRLIRRSTTQHRRPITLRAKVSRPVRSLFSHPRRWLS